MRILIVLAVSAALLAGQPLPLSSPEKVGLSPERLDRLHTYFEDAVKSGKRAGAVTMIVRNGKIADWRAYGYRDLEQRLPMEKDSIMRIWSMTKVVTSVAAMMLVEEGKLTLNDPVHKFIPEFKRLKVLKGGTADEPLLADATKPMTVKHLLTHTGGLTYSWGNDPVPELYRRANIFKASTLQEFAAKMATLPLVAEPGEKYNYGVHTDILGYVVQVASDTPFDQFVQNRILRPLKMNDTFFVVPADKKGRVAKTYTVKDGKLAEQAEMEELATAMPLPYGGMGLYSTVADYARFGQMLLNGGELEGARLLSRKTVELMTSNHIANLAKPHIDTNGADGFGLGGSVRIDIGKGSVPGSLGVFGWDGAASTRFRMDPKERTVSLLFQQYMPFDGPNLDLFQTLFYQAIVD
jgi:CubicO group peptidase (beta-lactamase class C family)